MEYSGYAFGKIQWEEPYQSEAWYLVFIYFWNHAFFVFVPQFVIASSCVCWYFRKSTNDKIGHPVV